MKNSVERGHLESLYRRHQKLDGYAKCYAGSPESIPDFDGYSQSINHCSESSGSSSFRSGASIKDVPSLREFFLPTPEEPMLPLQFDQGPERVKYAISRPPLVIPGVGDIIHRQTNIIPSLWQRQDNYHLSQSNINNHLSHLT